MSMIKTKHLVFEYDKLDEMSLESTVQLTAWT